MSTTMWKTFFTDENVHYLAQIEATEELRIYLTDLKHIWTEVISKANAYNRFLEINPSLEVDLDTAIKEVLTLTLSIGNGTEAKVSKSQNNLEFILKGTAAEFPVKYNFKCEEADAETFFKKVTVPLILTVKNQQNDTDFLIHLLQCKDKEIEQHVLENGEISRKELITEKFKKDEVLYANKIGSFVEVFESSSKFWKNFVKTHDPESKFVLHTKCPSPPKKLKLKVYSAETSKRKAPVLKYNMSQS